MQASFSAGRWIVMPPPTSRPTPMGIGVTRYRLARGAMRAAYTAGSPEEPYPSTSAGPICALHMKRKLSSALHDASYPISTAWLPPRGVVGSA